MDQKSAWIIFCQRLHRYIGVIIAPFMLLVAVTGILYVWSPQIEKVVYHDLLFQDSFGQPTSLDAQVRAAIQVYPELERLKSIRPASDPQGTTRVMFSFDGASSGESWAVFVNPITLDVQGQAVVYGTSGALPLRNFLSQLHRKLGLSEYIRAYSELVASWLWIAVISGVFLYWVSRSQSSKLFKLHTLVGLVFIPGLLFFSATGLTWSKWAGDHFFSALKSWHQNRPALLVDIPHEDSLSNEHHAPLEMSAEQHSSFDGSKQWLSTSQHPMVEMSPATYQPSFQDVLNVARRAGLTASKIEIRPSQLPEKAWVVAEINRSLPIQVDDIAIDPLTGKVVAQRHFKDYPILAKISMWGVDFHMGNWGLWNQILLTLISLALIALILCGYLMWLKKRYLPISSRTQTLPQIFMKFNRFNQCLLFVFTVLIGWAMPVLGVSVLCLLWVEFYLMYRKKT
ncbi:PepSY-associated TM helix domain-containing protein [Basilea psittacipulmonis]|uniref:PepSY domain-containing protein n=1 Tax=Basilea psittacipulmonis DSM 24701 TaxID=1072685 RepID=A0A077DEA9_9BURK|nr:PepSY-associated TM helix domain-containing protein [Basilea psittacipulmonis]AIL32506.1 hypothetical protein IX83_03575 [Basilea psittacipulmonis DSM 24701]